MCLLGSRLLRIASIRLSEGNRRIIGIKKLEYSNPTEHFEVDVAKRSGDILGAPLLERQRNLQLKRKNDNFLGNRSKPVG